MAKSSLHNLYLPNPTSVFILLQDELQQANMYIIC